jgi:tetratricopeptide (TPR) repeat protein
MPPDVTVSEAIRLGREHHVAGRLAEAERLYQHVLATDPNNPDALHLLGVVAHQVGRNEIAAQLIARAVDRHPSNPYFLNNLGEAIRGLRRPAEALARYDKALAIKPDYAEAWSNRANVLQELGRFGEALASCDKALGLRPGYAEALSNRGNALHGLKRNEEALASFDKALAIKPEYADASYNRGNALQALKRYGEALASYDKALTIRPDDAQAWCNRGNALRELGRYDEALASCDKALTIRPDYAEALCNRGNALQELKRHDEALASYRQALTLDPANALAHWNESLCRLVKGEFERGWQKYEWRWKCEYFLPALRDFSQPLWLGKEDIAGKAILLHAEQGLGDTLLFARYTQLVARKGARVILEVQAPLKPLLAAISGAQQVLSRGEPLPAFDLHCPLMSLPLAFNTSLQTIPATVPYLPVEKDAVSAWRGKLAAGNKRLVGLCWKGDQRYMKDRDRSMRLAQLRPLLACPGVQFVSLQKELNEEELALTAEMENFIHPGANFNDTAQMIGALDLVISVDTSWAHWAGAIGKPFWLLLPFVPYWIWLLERDDSPWYPTARLFRQTRAGDWQEVVQDVKREILRVQS